ncbi:MAG: UpxY family transcription antiterminator [Bacteroidetes bacterium]|nr:UpxY family transcription antiterminator [Bacteroidota bacterium]
MEELRKWFALYTKPRHEFKAAEQLNSISVENYLPTITKLKKWSDRKKRVTEPLFNGYIFIRATEKERFISVEQKAIIKTIFFDGKPSVIPEWQIDSLRGMLKETQNVSVLNELVTGNCVKVINGPFSGVEGVIYEVNKDETMLAISVEMLNRSVLVKLPAESIVKKSNN